MMIVVINWCGVVQRVIPPACAPSISVGLLKSFSASVVMKSGKNIFKG
jgi:hypothetical protein